MISYIPFSEILLEGAQFLPPEEINSWHSWSLGYILEHYKHPKRYLIIWDSLYTIPSKDRQGMSIKDFKFSTSMAQPNGRAATPTKVLTKQNITQPGSLTRTLYQQVGRGT